METGAFFRKELLITMGAVFEVLSTPPAYLKKALVRDQQAGRSACPIEIPFGTHRLQHCVLWEPDSVTHEECVMYFHGGGYLVGTPESMIDAANVYNSEGYRFCSIGFRLMPHDRFPAQVDDAFAGIAAARRWLREHGRPGSRFFVGGSSCGGHLAALVGYARWLQMEHGIDPADIAGVISVAAIVDVDDMLLKPFPSVAWPCYIGLPAEADPSSRHEALLPYSPIALLDQLPEGTILPPFFAIHGKADTLSPYRHEEEFVQRMKELGGEGAATLCCIEDPLWQHMWTTVTLHKDRGASSRLLSEVFSWMAQQSSC